MLQKMLLLLEYRVEPLMTQLRWCLHGILVPSRPDTAVTGLGLD